MDKKIIYLIFCGTSPQAIINSLWGTIERENIHPSKIIFLISKNSINEEKLFEATQNLIDEYGFSCELDKLEISESDIRSNVLEIKNYFKGHQLGNLEDNEIIIDITPGRKTMSISGVLFVNSLLQSKDDLHKAVKHIYYWHLKNDQQNQMKWLPEIPVKDLELVDLLEEGK